jgi:hypothetical protein
MSLEDRIWAELEPAARRRRPARLPAPDLRLAAGVVMLLVALAAGAALVGVLDRTAPTVKPGPRKVVTVPVAPGISDAAVGFGGVWIVDASHGLLRVDPATHRVSGRLDVPNPWLDARVVVAAGSVWLAPTHDTGHQMVPRMTKAATLNRIDPLTGDVTARIPLDAPGGPPIMPIGVVTASDQIWVWGQAGALRVDPRTNRVTQAIRVPGDNIKAFAAGGGNAWVVAELGRLLRFDVRTGRREAARRVAPVTTPFPLLALPGALIVHESSGVVAARDPGTGRALWKVRMPGGMRAAVVAGGRVWILTTSDTRPADDLVALDPATGRTVERISLPTSGGIAVAVVGSSLWVTDASGAVDIVHP